MGDIDRILRRNAIIVAMSLLAIGATVFILTMCQAKAFGYERMWFVGYANGKECCQGACHVYANIEDRIACCASTCPQFVDDCVKECVLVGQARSEVYAALSRAGKEIRGSTDKKAGMVSFLDVMTRVDDDGYSSTAKTLKEALGV